MRINENYFKNIPFTKKIAGIFILSLFVLLSIFYLMYRSNRAFIHTAQLVEQADEFLLQNQRLIHDAEDLRKSARAYATLGKREYLNRFYKLASIIPVAVQRLKEATEDNAVQKSRVVLVDSLISTAHLLEISTHLRELRWQKGYEATDSSLITGLEKDLIDELEIIVEQIDKEERLNLLKRKIENQRVIRSFYILLVTLELLLVSLLILGFRVIYNNTIKRNKAEGALKKSNYFISSIINNSGNPISVRDLSGNYLLLNDRFLKYVNVNENESSAMPSSPSLAKDLRSAIKVAEEKVINTKCAAFEEHQISLPTGIHSFTSSSFPLFDDNNNVYAIGSVLTDITVRKKTEDALRKSNEKLQLLINGLQQLMETSLNVICIFDEEGRFVSVSSACENLWGYSTEELIGRKYIELVHKDDREKTNEATANIRLGKRYNDFENLYCRKDGTLVPVLWVAMWREEEKLMYCIAKDGTEKKQTLKQLKDSEESLANAQKIARIGSWEIDLQKRSVTASEEFFSITGIIKKQQGNSIQDFYDIVVPADRKILTETIETAIRKSKTWQVEFRIVQANGNVTNVQGRGEIIFNEHNRPTWFKGTIQDITERKKLETERELVIEELTKSNADLKQFSFITSHNFRAPLSNITGILNLINHQDLDNYNSQLLEMLKSSANQLTKTIEDLTEILVIKSNANAAVQKISFANIYSKIEKVFSDALVEANGYIVTDFKAPYVTFNPVYLESVLINLISNAIKYRSPNRSLRISITTRTNEKGATCLVISDNGLGIDMNKHENKIFGLYQCFHENSEGYGVGLYIIKSQITVLGGKIEVTSEVGKGTAFTITFKEKYLETVSPKPDRMATGQKKVFN